VAAGKRVLLPVVLPGLDLDWAVYEGRDHLAPAVRGLLEPTGPRLGKGAIAQADVVLVPGTGVSLAGARLGQGGGCYDRALPRVSPGTPVAVVLYDDEVGLAVPAEPHDVRVGFALTSRGVTALLKSR
jgi:5-formyltetrahydrofolate cyclo-ligase